MSIGGNGTVYPVTPSDGGVVYDTMPYPSPTDGAWITVRVPADQLSDVVDELDDVGEVTATNLVAAGRHRADGRPRGADRRGAGVRRPALPS